MASTRLSLELLSNLRKGDPFGVWPLDRPGRSLKHFIEVVAVLAERVIGFKPLTEQIATICQILSISCATLYRILKDRP